MSRPSYQEQIKQTAQYLLEHDDFLIVSHVRPDGDAISSTLAVGLILKQLNKTYTMMNEDRVPERLSYLWQSSAVYLYADQQQRTFRNVVAVDCADQSRMGNVAHLLGADYTLLNIDHHKSNDYYGTCQAIKPDAAATVEILYDLIGELQLSWSIELAVCIYTGLLTDTGGFRYSNTSAKVMRIAAEMLEYGVDGSTLATHLLETMKFSQLKLLQLALNQLSISEDGQIAWVAITQAEVAAAQAVEEDLEGLVNYPRNIEGVEVGIFFKETAPEVFKASLRSGGKVDVSAIAQLFSGGGHSRAAGCTLYGTQQKIIHDVVEKVRQALL